VASAVARRVFTGAPTGARDHLVLSGATDLEQLPPPEDLGEPMRWLRATLAPDLTSVGARGVAPVAHDGGTVHVRAEVLSPDTVDALLPAGDRAPTLPELEPAELNALDAPALAALPLADAQPISRISYSGLQRYAACGYRFYLERALRLPRREDQMPAQLDAEALDALPPTVRGSVAHALLEQIDFAAPVAPEPGATAALIESFGEPVRDEEVADIEALITGFVGSGLPARLAGAEHLRTEFAFSFDLDTSGGHSLLVNGVVDVYARERDRTLIVDYKSDRLGDLAPAELVDAAYTTQRIVYALAALRGGAERAEVVYVFLERPDDTVTAVYEAADRPELEDRLRALAAGIANGDFAPSPRPWRGLCGDCPGQASLCSWGPEATLAPEPALPASQ
jgi:ATP-dependent exoDNAse (exonuclease V) beta subunit